MKKTIAAPLGFSVTLSTDATVLLRSHLLLNSVLLSDYGLIIREAVHS